MGPADKSQFPDQPQTSRPPITFEHPLSSVNASATTEYQSPRPVKPPRKIFGQKTVTTQSIMPSLRRTATWTGITVSLIVGAQHVHKPYVNGYSIASSCTDQINSTPPYNLLKTVAYHAGEFTGSLLCHANTSFQRNSSP